MLTQLVLAPLACLGICGALCLAAIKREIAIDPEDAKVMWTLHKQNDTCKCRKWRLLRRKKDQVIGFQCECGYKYTQKKPIIFRMPAKNKERLSSPLFYNWEPVRKKRPTLPHRRPRRQNYAPLQSDSLKKPSYFLLFILLVFRIWLAILSANFGD